MHETKNCKLGYGAEYNNCFGVKNGNTAPCPIKEVRTEDERGNFTVQYIQQVGRNRMCIYEKPEDSYEAFKIIWRRWYDGLPTLAKAKRWSGNDRAEAWLRNVLHHYHSDS